MNLTRLSAVVTMAVIVGACGTSYCERPNLCKNDPIATPADRDTCKATLTANQNSACYNEVLAFATCAGDNAVCGSDGKTDAALTSTKVTNNCVSQYVAQNTCCTKNPTATACSAIAVTAGDICDRKSPCANDPPTTQTARDNCKASLANNKAAACFKEIIAYATCNADSIVCGADGKIDNTASFNKTNMACSTQATAATTCCQANTTSTACK